MKPWNSFLYLQKNIFHFGTGQCKYQQPGHHKIYFCFILAPAKLHPENNLNDKDDVRYNNYNK